MPRPFLTAEWRQLLLVNYVAPPELLTPLLPAGVELDLWQGQALVSLVGFRFLRTRVLGVGVPLHQDFDELNLRFYVVRHDPQHGPRRGVCFIREFVPRPAIAAVAWLRYREPYLAVPMRHRLDPAADPPVAYAVRYGGAWHVLHGRPCGAAAPATDDPATAFITEHYWGYTRRGPTLTAEYEVVHPVWMVRPVADAGFHGDPGRVYGEGWRAVLTAAPASACYAEGSAVAVHPGRLLAAGGGGVTR